MTWKSIDGYYCPYRINDKGQIQRQASNERWYLVKPFVDRRYNTLKVSLRKLDGKCTSKSVKKLMVDTFLGGSKLGTIVGLRNGVCTDCSLENLYFLTQWELSKSPRGHGGLFRKTVEKIDQDGNVVEVYASLEEAARANFACHGSIRKRCNGQIQKPFSMDGHTYRWGNTNNEENTL